MKLFNKLNKADQKGFIKYYNEFDVNLQDVQSLDDFLADQGFELDPNPYGPEWTYEYEDNDDEVMIDYSDDVDKWRIYYDNYTDTNCDAIYKYFNSIGELIEYMR